MTMKKSAARNARYRPFETSWGQMFQSSLLTGVYRSWPQEWRHATVLSMRYLISPNHVVLELSDGANIVIHVSRFAPDEVMLIPGERVSYRLRWPPDDWIGVLVGDACYDQFIVGERRVFGFEE